MFQAGEDGNSSSLGTEGSTSPAPGAEAGGPMGMEPGTLPHLPRDWEPGRPLHPTWSFLSPLPPVFSWSPCPLSQHHFIPAHLGGIHERSMKRRDKPVTWGLGRWRGFVSGGRPIQERPGTEVRALLSPL